MFPRNIRNLLRGNCELSFHKKVISVVSRVMAKWVQEKEKYLSMDINEKRKLYKHYLTVEDIPTWKEYAKKQKLPEKISVLPTNSIDTSVNSKLVGKISIFKGNITELEIDCIVNAANGRLLGGGGVDGAIHRAAGPNLKEECRTLQGCEVGEAKITGGYRLPAKYVIHTVGPQDKKPESLMQCYKSSLDIMFSKNLKTIAFPCISTGIYGFPVEPAAHVAATQIRNHLEKQADSVDRVIFCLFLEPDVDIYQRVLQSYFPLE